MYEALFTSKKTLGNKEVTITFVPDFRQSLIYVETDENNKFYTNKGEYLPNFGSNFFDTYKDVKAPEDAEWFIAELYTGKIMVYVYGKTREIKTSFGQEFDKELNQMLREARKAYSESKKTELRVYQYNAEYNQLFSEVVSDDSFGYKYRFTRVGVQKSSIDHHFDLPKQSCILIGRVYKTIGNKKGKLHDFVEPVYVIYSQISSTHVMTLMKFSCKIKYEKDVRFFRIKSYMEKMNIETEHITPEQVAEYFNKELKNALEESNTERLEELYDILTKKQDCSKVNFIIRFIKEREDWEENEYFEGYECFWVEYENGEDGGIERAEWLYENSSRCLNASIMYMERKEKYRIVEI